MRKRILKIKKIKILLFIISAMLIIASRNTVFAQNQELDKNSKKTFKEAEKLYDSKMYDQALQKYEEVLNSNPYHIESLYKRALIEFDVNKNYKKAESCFTNLMSVITQYLKENPNLKEKEVNRLTDLKFECKNKKTSCATRENEYKVKDVDNTNELLNQPKNEESDKSKKENEENKEKKNNENKTKDDSQVKSDIKKDNKDVKDDKEKNQNNISQGIKIQIVREQTKLMLIIIREKQRISLRHQRTILIFMPI